MKVKFICSHCGKEVEWYQDFIHECDFYLIDDKWYCGSCINKIAKYFVESAVM